MEQINPEDIKKAEEKLQSLDSDAKTWKGGFFSTSATKMGDRYRDIAKSFHEFSKLKSKKIAEYRKTAKYCYERAIEFYNKKISDDIRQSIKACENAIRSLNSLDSNEEIVIMPTPDKIEFLSSERSQKIIDSTANKLREGNQTKYEIQDERIDSLIKYLNENSSNSAKKSKDYEKEEMERQEKKKKKIETITNLSLNNYRLMNEIHKLNAEIKSIISDIERIKAAKSKEVQTIESELRRKCEEIEKKKKK